MSIVRAVIAEVVKLLPPPRVIRDRLGEDPYLSRWYLLGRPRMDDGSEVFDELGNPRPGAKYHAPLGVYLHRFHKGDDDEMLHSHPWRWAFSIVLAGGYREERRVVATSAGLRRVSTDIVEVREVRPPALNVLLQDDYHRVDLLEDDAWSIFVVGPKVDTWWFWDRWTSNVVEWREHLRRVRVANARTSS